MSKKIVIDAGHGGSDPGAIGNGIIEKDYTLNISKYIHERLNVLKIPNELVRSSDVTIDPDERVKKILSVYGNGSNVIVLSNHINAGGGDGAEVIYALRNNDTLSKLIAFNIESEGQNFRKYYQRRLPSNSSVDYYYIIRDTANTEALIVEYGFLDSTLDDVTQLKSNWKSYAEAVVKSLAVYCGVSYIPPMNSSDIYYTVKSGDTLWSIAKNNNVSVDELKLVNNLDSNMLTIGQLIKIPNNASVTPDSNEYTYIVKAGDTLYGIARDYNIPVSTISTYNNLSGTLLSVGQVLKIPKVLNNYVVKSGDSLYKIAKEFNTSVDILMTINNLKSDLLSVGQQLIIPDLSQSSVYYVVKVGDNLYKIASAYSTTVSELMKLNNLNSDILSVGQKLKVK